MPSRSKRRRSTPSALFVSVGPTQGSASSSKRQAYEDASGHPTAALRHRHNQCDVRSPDSVASATASVASGPSPQTQSPTAADTAVVASPNHPTPRGECALPLASPTSPMADARKRGVTQGRCEHTARRGLRRSSRSRRASLAMEEAQASDGAAGVAALVPVDHHGDSDDGATQGKRRHEAFTVLGAARVALDRAAAKRLGQSRRNLPQWSIDVLKAWMLHPRHISHPYPTEQEKTDLAATCHIHMKQLTNWFTNARKRLWAPMMRKMGKDIATVNNKSHVSTLTADEIADINGSCGVKPAHARLAVASELRRDASSRVSNQALVANLPPSLRAAVDHAGQGQGQGVPRRQRSCNGGGGGGGGGATGSLARHDVAAHAAYTPTTTAFRRHGGTGGSGGTGIGAVHDDAGRMPPPPPPPHAATASWRKVTAAVPCALSTRTPPRSRSRGGGGNGTYRVDMTSCDGLLRYSDRDTASAGGDFLDHTAGFLHALSTPPPPFVQVSFNCSAAIRNRELCASPSAAVPMFVDREQPPQPVRGGGDASGCGGGSGGGRCSQSHCTSRRRRHVKQLFTNSGAPMRGGARAGRSKGGRGVTGCGAHMHDNVGTSSASGGGGSHGSHGRSGSRGGAMCRMFVGLENSSSAVFAADTRWGALADGSSCCRVTSRCVPWQQRGLEGRRTGGHDHASSSSGSPELSSFLLHITA